MDAGLEVLLSVLAGVEGGFIVSLFLLKSEMNDKLKHTTETLSYHVLLMTIILLQIWR